MKVWGWWRLLTRGNEWVYLGVTKIEKTGQGGMGVLLLWACMEMGVVCGRLCRVSHFPYNCDYDSTNAATLGWKWAG